MSTYTYEKDIVDPNDRASQFAHEVCMKSYDNCQALIVVPHRPKDFRGPVGFSWKNRILEQMKYSADSFGNMISPPAMLQEIENDGAGGKPQFFTLVGTPEVFYGLGWEIITMTIDDLARTFRFGGLIVNEMNVKDITEENFPLFQATMLGYGAALKKSNLANITGEIAVMKNSVTAFCDTGSPSQLVLNWGAACIGLSHRSLLADSSKITHGMIIVGFNEDGYRCNGGTYLKKITEQQFGPDPRDIVKDKKAISFAKKLTVPSKSYANTITRIAGWNPDGSIGKPLAKMIIGAHITGGGIGKFAEILPAGVSALLDTMPKPPEVLLEAQNMSWGTKLQLKDKDAYKTFHGGCGMLVVVPTIEDADIVISEAKKDDIGAQIVGETIRLPQQQVIINSRFREGKKLFMDVETGVVAEA